VSLLIRRLSNDELVEAGVMIEKARRTDDGLDGNGSLEAEIRRNRRTGDDGVSSELRSIADRHQTETDGGHTSSGNHVPKF